MDKTIPVLIGLSGGVDSAVAAYLLQKEGYSLIGVTALNFPDSRCCSDSAILRAKKLAHQLGFPHHVIDISMDFQNTIIDYFVESYQKGETPSPCTKCNRMMRFGLLKQKAMQKLRLEKAWFATGHYVNVVQKDQRYCIAQGADPQKDQSYMLYDLTQAQIKDYLAPLGKLTKAQVRSIAQEANLISAQSGDSQDICFVKSNYQNFIAGYSHQPAKPGDFLDQQGNILGQHKGIAFYTVGQRRGLGLSASQPYYVLKIDAKNNSVIVGFQSECHQTECLVRQISWQLPPQSQKFKAYVKIRYQTPAVSAEISLAESNLWKIRFNQPVDAITPGQAAVFYHDNLVLGGGIIDKVLEKPTLKQSNSLSAVHNSSKKR